MIQIKVPASSANLGPGFDSIGLALDLYNVFTFEKTHHFQVEGFHQLYDVNNNLVLKAYLHVLLKYHVKPIPVKISLTTNDIPVARGLGSSSSCIIAGVMAANEMANLKLSLKARLEIITSLEGHPDNVACAMLGGLVCAFLKEEDVITCSYEVSSKLSFYAIIPSFSLATNKARFALPNQLPYKAIISSLSRALQLPHAFACGEVEAFKAIFEDAIHEPYRYALIPNGLEIKSKLRELDCAVCISGSGPTLLVVSNNDNFILELQTIELLKEWKIVKLNVANEGSVITSL